ncbi:MAG: cupin-like domain-containing protein [Burkholderiales bacterium]|nr:cupin-like domain-containing protein [Burkholderiales bacterium]MDE2075581.1 cupin-like domain-containing protein [Burkholderiales bacterium]MDE2432877.1 cupin-like domain-containing protein [Burkholderiales bacterium]
MSALAQLADDALLTRPVDEVSAAYLPYRDFLHRFMRAGRPVVVTDVAPGWPALHKWTPAYFREQFGDRIVPVGYAEQKPFRQFIDEMLASAPGKPCPYMYRLFIHQDLPEVLPDLSPQSLHGFPRRLASPWMPHGWRRPDGFLKLLIGGPGSSFPIMHYDANGVHATVTEIYGDKEFVLIRPEDTPYVYARQDQPNKSLVFDPLRPDLTRFPLMAKVTPYRAVLKPGSMVFIPRGWWHTARPLTPSISIGMNIIDRSNWRSFVSETFLSGLKGARASGMAKAMIKASFYLAMGSCMSGMEWLEEESPRMARALSFPGRISPVSAEWAPDPATITIDPRSQHVG